MKKTITILLVLFSLSLFSQNVNVIIQVNERTLMDGEVSNLYIKLENNDTLYRSINYYPGDLILSKELLQKINDDSIPKLKLHFDYYTYKKGNQEIANFDIELNKGLLNQRYLIIDVYDFRDKKYKKWYQQYTKENYLVQLIYPQCGYYIRMID